MRIKNSFIVTFRGFKALKQMIKISFQLDKLDDVRVIYTMLYNINSSLCIDIKILLSVVDLCQISRVKKLQRKEYQQHIRLCIFYRKYIIYGEII